MSLTSGKTEISRVPGYFSETKDINVFSDGEKNSFQIRDEFFYNSKAEETI